MPFSSTAITIEPDLLLIRPCVRSRHARFISFRFLNSSKPLETLIHELNQIGAGEESNPRFSLEATST